MRAGTSGTWRTAARHALPTRLAAALSLCGALLAAPAIAQDAKPGVRADGTATAPAASVPYSAFASPQARAFFPGMLAFGAKAPPIGGPIAASRDFYDGQNCGRAELMEKLYPVKLKRDIIAGVGVDVVLPAQGVSPENRRRVLLNLHGGAFLWGAHSGALVESIPVASLGRIEVIGVDYRMGPEHVFPAASVDVENVYRELLKTHKPGEIGIYGCSAGGILTGEAVARFIHDRLPVPGAIGMFCGALVDLGGDSSYVAPMLNGQGVPTTPPLGLATLPYLRGADPDDPLVQPGLSPALLARFPPTLLITGTRDFAMSSVVHSGELLHQAGVPTELRIWDGMWHSFFSDPQLPESKQAYAAIVGFFDRRLAR
ncbi:alpha/beta hydrolase [Rhodanobacter hydrolyticus]|uniref:Alpha/beta hydrolase fold domain-containing protein n=1 Tax=Rhodanobacter hydrolyticus TaxID=2250595 RepID=A0ABW8J558_9GAMM